MKRISITQQLDRALLLLFRQAKAGGATHGGALGQVTDLLAVATPEPTDPESGVVKMLRTALDTPGLAGGYEDDGERGDGEAHARTPPDATATKPAPPRAQEGRAESDRATSIPRRPGA